MIESDKKSFRRDDPEAEAAKRESRKHTRRSFLVAGLGAAAGYEFYRYIARAHQLEMLPAPLRHTLNFNAHLSRDVFEDRALAPTYPRSKAVDLRVNGVVGLGKDLELDSWRLQLVGVENPKQYAQYTPDVTAWNYRYTGDNHGDQGHDTKERPPASGAGNAQSNGKPATETKPSQKNTKDMMPAGKSGTSPAPQADGQPDPYAAYANMPPEFRKAFNEMIKANGGRPPRGNGEAGESDSTLDPGTPGLLLTMDDLQRLPFQEFTTQFKCIEGWSEIVHWGGYRLRDLLAAYPPARKPDGSLPKYVYMETPNGDYYTGYTLLACQHPQSLLTTEMSGRPLTQVHGAPVRLHMPIKYGYKQIKRIALIAYMDEQPDDYWTKLGYDWYAGL